MSLDGRPANRFECFPGPEELGQLIRLVGTAALDGSGPRRAVLTTLEYLDPEQIAILAGAAELSTDERLGTLGIVEGGEAIRDLPSDVVRLLRGVARRQRLRRLSANESERIQALRERSKGYLSEWERHTALRTLRQAAGELGMKWSDEDALFAQLKTLHEPDEPPARSFGALQSSAHAMVDRLCAPYVKEEVQQPASRYTGTWIVKPARPWPEDATHFTAARRELNQYNLDTLLAGWLDLVPTSGMDTITNHLQVIKLAHQAITQIRALTNPEDSEFAQWLEGNTNPWQETITLLQAASDVSPIYRVLVDTIMGDKFIARLKEVEGLSPGTHADEVNFYWLNARAEAVAKLLSHRARRDLELEAMTTTTVAP